MAVQHIVWLQPRDGTGAGTMDEILAAIRGLETRVPGVSAISAGSNFTQRAAGYSHGAIITLQSREALQPYLDHPEHQRVGALIRRHCDVLVMDYEDGA